MNSPTAPRSPSKPENCPCGSGKPYVDCCGLAHGGFPAPTAEALMRSRYAAFVLRLEPYIYETWHPTTRPKAVRLLGMDPPPTWLGLEVRRTATNGDRAEVEFVARFREGGGRAVRMHETSRFVLETGRWYYVDGDQHEKKK